jgi:hypothetical protein
MQGYISLVCRFRRPNTGKEAGWLSTTWSVFRQRFQIADWFEAVTLLYWWSVPVKQPLELLASISKKTHSLTRWRPDIGCWALVLFPANDFAR